MVSEAYSNSEYILDGCRTSYRRGVYHMGKRNHKFIVEAKYKIAWAGAMTSCSFFFGQLYLKTIVAYSQHKTTVLCCSKH
jgi:hypothetical protein